MKKTILLLLICAFSPWAVARCPQFDGAGSAVIHLSMNQTCIGWDEDEVPPVSEIRGQLDELAPANIDTDNPTQVADLERRAIQMLESLRLDLSEEPRDQNYDQAFQLSLDRLAEAEESIVLKEPRPATRWRLENYTLQDGEIDLASLLDADCSGGENAACVGSYRQAETLLRYSTLTASVLHKSDLEQHDLGKAYAQATSQWEYYFGSARSQYIWELALNHHQFGRSLLKRCREKFAGASGLEGEALEAHCTTRRDVDLAPPPTGQWILFHPNAAAEYVSSDDSGNSAMRLVAIVELIGYNWFARLDDQGWKPRKWPVGVSLVSTVSLDSNGDRFGYGGMLHLRNNLSLGVARRKFANDYETTWLMSIDLGKMFLDVSEEWKKRFKSI